MLHMPPPSLPSSRVPASSLVWRNMGSGSNAQLSHFREARRMDPAPDAAIDALRSRGLDSLPPLAIVLGSGLGAFADEAHDAIALSYAEISGFPKPSVEGHAGRLVVGPIEGERVALFQGRGHYYERGDAHAIRIAIET